QAGQGQRGLFRSGLEVEFDRAADAVEALAVTLRTRRAVVGEIIGGIDAELAEARGRVVLLVLIDGLEHPRENVAVAAAGGTPAARGVEGEILRVELGEALAG